VNDAAESVPPTARAPIRRAAITNLGCKVNQAEMDAIERLLRARGVEIAADGSAADLHVVNTCTVTATADHKSRKAVRGARRASPDATVLVTGCSVAVAPEAFLAADPAARLIDNLAKDGLVAEVERLLGLPDTPHQPSHGPLDAPLPTLAGVEIEGSADTRAVGTFARIDRTRAFIKVQDGCSFHCTYCIIPRARGEERSMPPDAVLADVRRALAAGHREIVLTGINIGTYDGGWSERGFRGAHSASALTLPGLVRRILSETPVERIRLSSIEPQHVDDELLASWTVDGAGRCLPHFHLPLQSGDDGVLRRMGRRYDAAFYADVVARVRSALPRAAVHADVIVGFPTEDEAAFERSLAFIRGLDLAGIHVFRYSSRPGTPATRMAGQVTEADRKARAAILLAEAAASRSRFAARAVGEERTVLFEDASAGDGWVGHAEDHVLVRAAAADGRPLEGVIARVRVEAVDPAEPERVTGALVAPYP
jgi:threonylcarbamoyladenosine tRNA methylthiotransferase MtaB